MVEFSKMQIIFKSQLTLNKYIKEGIRSQLIALFIMICLTPIAPYIKRRVGGEDDDFVFEWILISFLYTLLLSVVYIKFIETIQFDYKSQSLKITYYIFFIKKERIIKFNNISFKQKNVLSNFKMKSSVIIFENNKKRFTITADEDGWEDSTVKEVIKHLEQITTTNKKDLS